VKFIDFHEDLAYASAYEDVRRVGQSSLMKLSLFPGSIVFGVVYPHVRTLGWRDEEMSSLYGGSAYSTSPSIEVLWTQVKFYRYLEDSGKVRIIGRGWDPIGVNLVLSLEGTDVMKEAYDIFILKDLGIRAIGLTWNYDTKFAASCRSKKDYGLTGEGEELVRLANRLGIILDVSHTSHRTTMEVCQASRRPVIASHSNVMKLKDSPRNLRDEAIEAIIKTGGVIGVTAINSTLPKPTLEGMVEAIKYVGESFGWEYVALGSDFLGVEELPSGFEGVEKVPALAELIGDKAEKFLWENGARVLRSYGLLPD
jgi:Zn-dependent dipeptidase, microsomal dipeptidase homolog